MSHVDEAARQLSKSRSPSMQWWSLRRVPHLKTSKRPTDLSLPSTPFAPQPIPVLSPRTPLGIAWETGFEVSSRQESRDVQSTEIFKEINTAHSILSDPKKRKIYERHGSLGIHRHDHVGEEDFRHCYMMNSCWFKVHNSCSPVGIRKARRPPTPSTRACCPLLGASRAGVGARAQAGLLQRGACPRQALVLLCALLTCCCCCCLCCGALRPPPRRLRAGRARSTPGNSLQGQVRPLRGRWGKARSPEG
ncbi:LOW QUALITY PROTEIN: hypothetical protein MC885_009823 [Smutsia gigantea]|nr:LOW QUALITY PROTEIN: hypothetical protein MC885_009823 [Smutsia gigantea]